MADAPHVATVLNKAMATGPSLFMYASLESRVHTVCVRRPSNDASIQLPVCANLAENVLQPVDSRYQRLSQAF